MSDSLVSTADPVTADPVADPVTTTTPYEFYKDGAVSEQFATQLGDNKSAKAHFDKYAGAENPFEAAMTGIKDLNFMVGQKERLKPAEDASDEDKATWNAYIKAQNGVPDDSKGYGWEKPEDIAEDHWNQGEVDVFADILHKGNVSPDTAKELFSAYNESLRGAPEAMQAQIDQQLAVEKDILQAEYGMETDKMLQSAVEGGNLKGLPIEETQRIASTALGVKLLAEIKNMHVSDITSGTQSSNGMSQGGNSNYEEQALASAMKANEAHDRGDMTSYKKFAAQQTHYNQLHANASR